MSDSYLGATEADLLGTPLARRRAAYSDQRRLIPHQGTRRLIAAFILTALIVVCVSGCHFRVTVHAGPPLRGPAPAAVSMGAERALLPC